MKKNSTVSLLLVLLVLSSYAQEVVYISSPKDSTQVEPAGNKYSKESLAKASPEDLNLYLEKAHKLKRKGGIVSIVGPVTSLAGIGIRVAAYRVGTSGEYTACWFITVPWRHCYNSSGFAEIIDRFYKSK